MKIGKGLLTVLSFLIGCSLHAQDLKNPNGYIQLFQVSSDLSASSEKFFYENDTIKVTYYLWANKGIMQISIFNKKDFPIYIDWKKSYMKSNLDTLVYAYESSMNAQNSKMYKSYLHEGRTLSGMDYETDYQMGEAKKAQAESTVEVKPKGFYMSLRYHIITGFLYNLGDKATLVTEARTDDPSTTTDVYETSFDTYTTPLKFASALTYSTTKDFASSRVVSNNFWVSKIREMIAPHFMGEKVGKTPEGFAVYKFPFRKSTSFYLEIDKKNSTVYKKSKK